MDTFCFGPLSDVYTQNWTPSRIKSNSDSESQKQIKGKENGA